MKRFDHEVRYRLTRPQKAQLIAAAIQLHMSQSDVVRLAVERLVRRLKIRK